MFEGRDAEAGSRPLAERRAPASLGALASLGSAAPVALVDLMFARMVGVLIAERSATWHARAGAGDVQRGGGSAGVGDGALVAARGGDLVAGAAQGGDPVAGDLAEVLEGHDSGGVLVGLLEGLDPARVSDAALVEGVAAWERVTSLAAARQADLIAELLRRRTAARAGEFVGDEVAARLGTTRAVAEAKVGLAACLEVMPEVRDALLRGLIDVRKAVALTDGVAHLPVETARAVQVRVLPDAGACQGFCVSGGHRVQLVWPASRSG